MSGLVLSVPRGIQCHVSVSPIRCHCVDFDLVTIYVFLFQFGTHLCVSYSILSQFFNKKNIFVIHLFKIKTN